MMKWFDHPLLIRWLLPFVHHVIMQPFTHVLRGRSWRKGTRTHVVAHMTLGSLQSAQNVNFALPSCRSNQATRQWTASKANTQNARTRCIPQLALDKRGPQDEASSTQP